MARRKRILVVNGHPDPRPERFTYALASAYARGAREGGHDVRILNVGALDFPLLRTAMDFEQGQPPPKIAECQANLKQADHLVIFFPLWLGAMPALLKGYFEQVLRPRFAFEYGRRKLPRKLLKGKSARVVVTMGMPAAIYRWAYRSHSLKSLERNILGFCGIRTVGHDVIGLMGEPKAVRRERWLAKMEQLGRRAA
ncbi:MAG TPA: NAD(P)H-dependent oxidoreductase [Steroidobacteraceae bacterium]|nr:NAD(P)H-dependent oxidoreductase [Steroidobacteraceae bacterium]